MISTVTFPEAPGSIVDGSPERSEPEVINPI